MIVAIRCVYCFCFVKLPFHSLFGNFYRQCFRNQLIRNTKFFYVLSSHQKWFVTILILRNLHVIMLIFKCGSDIQEFTFRSYAHAWLDFAPLAQSCSISRQIKTRMLQLQVGDNISNFLFHLLFQLFQSKVILFPIMSKYHQYLILGHTQLLQCVILNEGSTLA